MTVPTTLDSNIQQKQFSCRLLKDYDYLSRVILLTTHIKQKVYMTRIVKKKKCEGYHRKEGNSVKKSSKKTYYLDIMTRN